MTVSAVIACDKRKAFAQGSAAKQSMLSTLQDGLLRCARNDGDRYAFHFGEFLMYRFLAVALLSIALASGALAADTKPHRVTIQIDQNDPQVMNLVLSNATNVIEHYRAKSEDVDIDIVAYGPGLHMLRSDTSPVQDRIKRLKDMVFPGKIQFSACNNTKQGMEKTEGHAISVVPEATIVPSGVVHLMELQEQGWSYVRP
jgi:intracellular sulfur oxidation DsrE/DsrF family protein